jgi:gas vesicle protein
MNAWRDDNAETIKLFRSVREAQQRDIAETARVISRELALTTQGIREALMPHITAFREGLAEAQAQLAAELAALNREAKEVRRQAMPLLRETEWILPMSIPYSFVGVVAHAAARKTGGRALLRAQLLKFYSRDQHLELRRMVTAWKSNPLFRRRMRIIEDCVRVVAAGRRGAVNPSNVVLPALIAQVEGILRDYTEQLMAREGRVPEGGPKALFRKVHEKDLTSDLVEILDRMLWDVLFQHSDRGKPLRPGLKLSRHKIMHGEDTRYGKREHVLRVFFMLDYLAFASQRSGRGGDTKV